MTRDFHWLLYTVLFSLQTSFAQVYQFENLGDLVNSGYAELAPIISTDGLTLYFHRSNHPKNSFGASNSQDIWYTTLNQEGKWTYAQRLPPPLNNDQFNSIKGVSPDGNTLLLEGAFEKGRYTGKGLSFSHRTDKGWTLPQKIEVINYQKMAQGLYGSSSLSNDGKTLILAFSETHGSNFDDLYVSRLDNEKNIWSQPQSLGEQVNTKFTETTPFLASDGVTLYFSSNRPGGMGKNDIYFTKRLDDTWLNWSEPKNLGPSINTEAWEAYYSIDAEATYAYMISSKNSRGKTDIVRIKLLEENRPDPVVLISGKVYNAKTKTPLKAAISYEILPQGENAGYAHSSSSGDYKIVLPYGKNYGFLAETAGFVSISDNIDLTQIAEYQEIERDLFLVPLEVGETVRLNNIFFDFGKYQLRPGSYPELERVYKLLAENPNLSIEIGGHTDDVGPSEENTVLSLNRAGAVKKYLIDKGIPDNKVKAGGFGEARPLVPNNSESNQQLNRRVEFTILKK